MSLKSGLVITEGDWKY